MEDAFDARLKAAFAAAQQPGEDDAKHFAEAVIARLGRPNRRRTLVIGGAGTTGSALASTQLENLFSGVDLFDPTSSRLGEFAAVFNIVSPEMLAAVMLAAVVAGVAFVLPNRV